MERINNNENIFIEILTPTHIGAGGEKSWVSGVNYVYENGTVYIIDEKKFAEGLTESEITQWANAISQGKSGEFIKGKNKNLSQISSHTFTHSPKPEDDIKVQIRTGLGIPMLPGSSIKGAIRSAIFGWLYQNDTNIKKVIDNRKNTSKDSSKIRLQDPNITLFGEINDNVMRLIRITDAEFKKTDLFSTKTFNLKNNSGNWKAAWKFALGTGNNKIEFQNEGFVFTYEVLPVADYSECRIGIAEGIIALLKEKNRVPANTDKIIKENDPLIEIFKMINEHTAKYLDREISFYKKYGNNETELIIAKLQEIKKEIPTDNSSCILHLGCGSGFHGITGDWRFTNDHSQTINNPDKQNKDRRYKSRKLAFESDIENDYTFYSMGFVKLHLEESWKNNQQKIEEKKNQEESERNEKARKQRELEEIEIKKQEAQKAAEEEAMRKAEEEKRLVEEARIAEEKRKEEELKKFKEEEEKAIAIKRQQDVQSGLVFLSDMKDFDDAKKRIDQWLKKANCTSVPENQHEILFVALQRFYSDPKNREKKKWEAVFEASPIWKKITEWVGKEVAEKWYLKVIRTT